MATRTRQTQRREDALSRERIVDAAVAMLDTAGESGLTFRALAAELRTGAGAIYWHVANKGELLVAATDAVLESAMADERADATAEDAVRGVALDVFEAVHAHPWAGTQLSLAPTQPATLRIFERIGRQLHALGVPVTDLFMSTSALLNYILGVGGQSAANAASFHARTPDTTRAEFLASAAAAWASLDPDEYPFTREAAAELRDHDDRAQFLAGIDLILAGIVSTWRSPATPTSKRRRRPI